MTSSEARDAAIHYLNTVIAADAEDLAEHLNTTPRHAGNILRGLKQTGHATIVAPRADLKLDGRTIPSYPLWATTRNASEAGSD